MNVDVGIRGKKVTGQGRDVIMQTRIWYKVPITDSYIV